MAAVIRPQSIRPQSAQAQSVQARSAQARSAQARSAQARSAQARSARALAAVPAAPLPQGSRAAAQPTPQSHPGGVARPSLRLIEGGRSPRALATQQRYLRRRALALVVALVVGLLAVRGAAAVASGLAAGTAGPGSAAVATTTHRASAGDTLWEIAGRYAPQVDRRVAMDDLLAINGGAALQVGQEVLLPASWF